MLVDRSRRRWARALDARVQAVHEYEVAAAMFERLGDRHCAEVAAAQAADARIAYARVAAQHPEWSADVSAGLT